MTDKGATAIATSIAEHMKLLKRLTLSITDTKIDVRCKNQVMRVLKHIPKLEVKL